VRIIWVCRLFLCK